MGNDDIAYEMSLVRCFKKCACFTNKYHSSFLGHCPEVISNSVLEKEVRRVIFSPQEG